MTNNDDKFNDPIIIEFIKILESNGFQIIYKLYDSKHFGNIIVDMCRDQYFFRLLKDRGVWEISVKNQNRSYTESTMLYIRALLDKIPLDDIVENWKTEEQIKYLETNFDEIISSFSDQQIDDTEDRIRKIDSVWMHKILPEAFPEVKPDISLFDRLRSKLQHIKHLIFKARK